MTTASSAPTGGAFPKAAWRAGSQVFDLSGRSIWKNTRVRLLDCYALNVAGRDAWFYAYDDFDLHQVTDLTHAGSYETGLSGCENFALSGTLALFSAEYHDPAHRFHLVTLADGSTPLPAPLTITQQGGAAFGKGDIRMRGPYLHVFAQGAWYRGHIDDLK
ncbi:MAG: hypothetical protein R3D85_12085 [Paracoccaceae bacterium]